MTFPNQLPEWATSPSDPPNDIIDPGASVKAEGWDPDQRPPAGWMNYWQNLVYRWILALAFTAVKTWTLERDISPTTPQEFFSLGYDTSTGVLIATGDTAAVATFFSVNGGKTWVAPAVAPLAVFARGIDSDNAGNWVIVGDSLSCSESSDDGDNWTTRTLGLTSDTGNTVHYDATNSLWIVTGDNTGDSAGRRIWTSPDRVTWTSRLSDASGSSVGDFWVNDAGFSVALSNSNNFYTSTDGVTWTARSITGPTTLNSVVYSEGLGIWMIAGSDGARTIYTSTDGITFTEPAGSSIDNKALTHISCDQGGLFLVGHGAATANAELYASVDSGVTWTQVTGWGAGLSRGPAEAHPTPTAAGSTVQDLHFFGGRFMTVDRAGNFWHSLSL